MNLLTPVWRHLEVNAGAGLPEAGWRLLCGDGLPLVRGMLVGTGERAGAYPSPTRNAAPLRVHRHRDGSLVGVCDEDPTFQLELTPQDVVLLGVPSRDLRRAVAGALKLRVSKRPAPRLPGVIPVGLLEPAPSVAYPVILVSHPGRLKLAALVRDSVLAEKRPVLVLTPTDDGWTDELREWVEAHRGTMVPADDVVEVDEKGRWVATELWSWSRESFLKRAGFNAKAVKTNKRKESGGRDKELRAHSVNVSKALRTLIGNRRSALKNMLNKGVTEIKLPHITLAQIAKIAGSGCRAYHITRIRQSGKYPVIVMRLDALNDVVKLRDLPRR